MKVNLRRNTMDKEKRPQTGINNGNNNPSIEEFRLYINNLESLLRDTLNDNVKLTLDFVKDLDLKIESRMVIK